MVETASPSASAPAAQGPAVRDKVLAGKDGWLFLYGGSHDQFGYLLGERNPNEASVAAFWSNIEGRAAYAARRDLPYLHVVFPSKPVTMTRFLPDELQDRVQSLYLRHYAPAAPAGAADHVLYPLDDLRALDATERPFLPADTHLSDAGLATVARAALARWGLGYDLAAHFRPGQGTWPCDLTRMLGGPDTEPGRPVLLDTLGLTEFDNRHVLASNGGNVVLLHSPRSSTARRLAVVGDSFFRLTLRFLAPVFRDILYLRGPGLHAPTLDRFQPDALMTGNAERYLAQVHPDDRIRDILSTLTRTPGYHPGEAFQAALASQLKEDPLDALRREIAEQAAELAALREKVEDRGKKLRALREERTKQARRIAELESTLARLRGSLSWRLARPLRAIESRLRRPRG